MADLSNLKISSTYPRVLQRDPDTGNLQDLVGDEPTNIIFNGTTLRYVDGNQEPDYVLTSDANGNARWAVGGGGGSTNVYWSASSVDGSFIVNSGMTNSKVGIGTTIPNHELSVSGTISASSSLYGSTLYSGSTNLADILITLSADSDYWSASTTDDGSLYVVNSGLTTTNIGIGTPIANERLTVSGSVSASSSLYGYNLYATNITTTATSTDTLSIQADIVDIKSHGGSVDYLRVKDDQFQFFFDGGETVAFYGPSKASPGYNFNAGSQDIDFKINGTGSFPIFNVTAAEDRIRMRDHLVIGTNSAIPHADAVKWGLAVTGSSLFFGSETGSTTHAIHASGVISGSSEVLVGDGNGFISAATIEGQTLSGVSTYGDTIYSGSTDLADILITLSADTDYWTGNTNGSISTSGDSTNLELGGNISLPDNGEILLGAGNDLSIIHNSIKSIITNTTGELLFENEADNADIRFKGTDDTSTITALTLDMSDEGTAIFNHDISLPDNGQILLGAGDDLKIYHSGSHSIIQDAGAGDLQLKGSIVKIRGTSVSEDCAIFNENGSVELYYDNAKKLETTNTGISASTEILVGNGDGAVSAQTFVAPNFNSDYTRFYTGNTDGSTFIGYQAGLNGSETDNYATAVGWRALYSIDGSPAGNYTQAFGFEAAYSQNSGSHNTAVGFRALYSNQTTTQQIAIGGGSMKNHTSGNKNTIVGYASASFMSGSSSAENVALGHSVMAGANEGGSGSGVIRRNVMIGYHAGAQTDSGSQGNTIVGHDAVSSGIFTGDYNVMIGKEAGDIATSADYNIMIGFQAGNTLTTGDNNIAIGYNAQPASATDSFQLNISNLLYGRDAYSNSAIKEFGINRRSPVTALDVVHENLNNIADDEGGGDIVTFGTSSGALTAGKLYYLNSSGVWTLTQANGSSNNGNSQLLGIALGTAVGDGVLLRGFFDMASYLTGTFSDGIPVYVCETTAGNINVTQPTGEDEFVRVVGYCCDAGKVIYFNPDGTYITVSA
jgi:hypothetical protein